MSFDAALKKISVLAELERCGLDVTSSGSHSVKVLCQWHDDRTPSMDVDTETRRFKCFSCGESGDIVSLVAKVAGLTRAEAWATLSLRYKIDDKRAPIDPRIVARYHQALLEFEPLINELARRGINMDTIKRYDLGRDRHRVIVPIRDESGAVVNLRKYMPGGPSDGKFRSSKGRGKAMLYPLEQLEFDRILVCGGDLKALAAAQRLNPLGIGAITSTGGEGSWSDEFTKLLHKKSVGVCMDVDAAGYAGANAVCGRMYGHVRALTRIDLPLSIVDYPTGDISDYFGIERKTANDLMKLWDSSEEWRPKARSLSSNEKRSDEPERVTLSEATNAESIGKRMLVLATVSGVVPESYSIPSKILFSCGHDQKVCPVCPMRDSQIEQEITIEPTSLMIPMMMDVKTEAHRGVILSGLNVPSKCASAEITPMAWHEVCDAKISPSLSITERESGQRSARACIVGPRVDLNEAYDIRCLSAPHPRTQQTILMADAATPVKDALSAYQPADDHEERLKIFRPSNWTIEALTEKLAHIYDDLAANVTRIFDRRDLHIFFDLAYHSVLSLKFDGQPIKGWTELLIIGDSAQGKSETMKQLMSHYGLGEKVDCKNATVAGLLGGSVKFGEKWIIAWGIIPTQDRRLVILDEMKGMHQDAWAKLTDMRSSGVAEIPKIERRKTNARTRLLGLSNPRSSANMASYAFGVNAVLELLGSPEDVRRFDAVLGVSAVEIAADRINVLHKSRPKVEHVYTNSLCRELILFAWTRDHDQVKFERHAESDTLAAATSMCEKFVDDIPIVDRGSMRQKIARLATALAVRTFSTLGECVLVRRCHVEYVVAMLERVYSGPVLGYAEFSKAVRSRTQMKDPRAVKTRVMSTPYVKDLIESLLATDEIGVRDLRDWCGFALDDAIEMTANLVRGGALVRVGRDYRKTPAFIEMLRSIVASGELSKVRSAPADEI